MSDKFDERANAITLSARWWQEPHPGNPSLHILAEMIADALRSVATPAGEDVGRLIVARLREEQRTLAAEDMSDAFVLGVGHAASITAAGAWRSTPLPAPTGYEPNASDPVPLDSRDEDGYSNDVTKLKRLLKSRDEFLVSKDLFSEYAATLPDNPVTVPSE